MQTPHGKNQIPKPQTKLNLSAALSTPIPPEPRTVNHALKDTKWRGALTDEIDAFARNNTFDLVPRQSHFNVIGCKWLFKKNFSLTAVLVGARRGLLPKVITKNMVVITRKHSVQ